MIGKYFPQKYSGGSADDSTFLESDENLDQFFLDSADNAAKIIANISCFNGTPWIWIHFGECVETPANLAGFVIGFISLLLWLVPLIPQLYENYCRQSCEGLSIYFLLFWICGDSLNFLGAMLTEQLPIQKVIGVYYLLQDFLLLGQFAWYTGKDRWSKRLESDLGRPSQVLACIFMMSLSGTVCTGGRLFLSQSNLPKTAYFSSPSSVHGFQSRKLLSRQFFIGVEDEVGYAVGSISALSYFCGRIPQLFKNYRRKSTEGVSVAMFVIIVFGNLTYGLSVLLAGQGWFYVMRHLPWLAGSLGCCFLDFLVISQFFYYADNQSSLENSFEEEENEDDKNRLLETVALLRGSLAPNLSKPQGPPA